LYDLDLETASEAIKKRVAYIRKFIARFYPDIADKINFYDGSEEDYEETRRRINDLVQKITVEEASNPRLAGIINQLKLSARKYGCTDAEAYSYLAANFVYGGNLDSYSPFASPNEATVISTGGVSEMPFFNFNSEFARPNKHAGLIVPFGSRPTYYPCLDRSDPVSHCEFEDCFKSEFGSVTDFHIRSDLQALAKKGLTPEVLGEIY
jgi:hypothetical protein